MNKIQQFIMDNKLDFSDSGSSLNSNCVIIAGYACYLGLSEDELISQIDVIEDIDLNVDVNVNANSKDYLALENELRRVFSYAQSKNYGNWWNTNDATKMYKF